MSATKGADTKGRKAKKFIADGKTLKKKAKTKGHKARKKFVKLIGRHVESHKWEEPEATERSAAAEGSRWILPNVRWHV